MGRELQVAVFLPPIRVLSGGVERMIKTMEHSRNVSIHPTVYLEPGLLENRETEARLEALAERGVVSIVRKGRVDSRSSRDYDAVLIPSEFWQRARMRADTAGARGMVHIEFQQLPYAGTLDVVNVGGHAEMTPLDVLRFPLAASRILGDPLPFSTFRLAACVASVRRAGALRDARFMATTPVVLRQLRVLGFRPEMFVPRVPLGVEAAPLREARDHPEDRIYDAVFVGRYHPHKGFLDLPRIAAHLRESIGGGVRIAVCGTASSPRYLHRFERLVADYGVRENLVMLGRVSREDLYRTIRRSSILLYPSYVDSFSITVLESLSLGTPVLAYAIDALRWTWRSKMGVYLSPVGDPRALAEAFAALRREGALELLAKGLAVQSERLLNDYTWDATVQEERRFLEGMPSPAPEEVEAEAPVSLPG